MFNVVSAPAGNGDRDRQLRRNVWSRLWVRSPEQSPRLRAFRSSLTQDHTQVQQRDAAPVSPTGKRVRTHDLPMMTPTFRYGTIEQQRVPRLRCGRSVPERPCSSFERPQWSLVYTEINLSLRHATMIVINCTYPNCTFD
jgi:hypothetical protein